MPSLACLLRTAFGHPILFQTELSIKDFLNLEILFTCF